MKLRKYTHAHSQRNVQCRIAMLRTIGYGGICSITAQDDFFLTGNNSLLTFRAFAAFHTEALKCDAYFKIQKFKHG